MANWGSVAEMTQGLQTLADASTEAFIKVLDRMHRQDRMLLEYFRYYDQRRKELSERVLFYRRLSRVKLHFAVHAKVQAIIADLQTIPVTPPG